MKRWAGLALLLVTAGALALRGPKLDLRPLHNDEAVNAVKIKSLWETGHYRYDPNEHHGPTLYYATLPFVWLSGAQDYDHLSEIPLRAVSVCFGLIIILLLVLLADGLGWPATLLAALFTAISPAMVFYSRYFIHEMLLVCFTLLLFVGAWRYSRKPHPGWAALAGGGLGLMYATKETFAIAAAVAAAALALTVLWGRWREGMRLSWREHCQGRDVALGSGVAALVSLVLFTSFFTNANGPLDSLRTYAPWLKRAGGESPHIHPWSFYLERLVYFKDAKGPVWSEGLIVALAAVAGIAALARQGAGLVNVGLARFLTFYTVLLTAAYSLISYKTPWCLLGFLQPMILLAGLGAAWLIQRWRDPLPRMALGIVLLAGAAQLTWQAWRASYPFAADRRNPYVYAQTVPDVLRLVQKVQQLGRVHPAGNQMLIKVMAPESDYWPLPWYLRQFKRVGWWDRLAADPYAPLMIVSAKWAARLDDRSEKKWLMVGYFELRPKIFLELYVQDELWAQDVQTLPPPAEE